MSKFRSIITLLTVLCIAAWTFNITVKACKDFSHPSNGPELPIRNMAPVRFYSCIEKQRIMRDEKLYKGAIDGLRGTLTIDAEKAHNKLYNEWANNELWPEAE